tara:strand:- start:1478 stop:2902 length:1425 start_codon:yes stop_codon:yes gene_type:complete
LLLALAQAPANAQATAAGDVAQQAGQAPADLHALVELLEDPQRRADFLARIRELEQVRDSVEDEQSLELSQALQLDQRVGKLLKNSLTLLSGSDIRASSVGKIVALATLGLVAILLALANRWLARTLDRNLARLRRRLQLDRTRFSSVFTWQRLAGSSLIVLAWVYATAVVVFDQDPEAAIGTALQAVIQTAVAVLLVVLLFLLIWEFINALLESLAGRKAGLNNRRAMTLLPVVRNVLTFILVLMSSLVILSELGVDVVPLLAGAGVVGIAVGFGAQTLVKDFLTGFTIIIEDLLQIDDVVTVAGRTGQVSHISMRKLELRSLDGIVHTVPFSAIDIVDNLTKDYSYYLLEVGVAYRENTDEVVQCLLEIDEELRASEEFGEAILEPLEVLGVDAFADSAVIIKARTKTVGRERWNVGREFNRRIKLAFDERNIEIPFPHQTLYFGEDKEGKAPPLPLKYEALSQDGAEPAQA